MNTQIKEDYVDIELARLLKEKGFRAVTNRYYNAQYEQIRTVSDAFMMDWNDEKYMKSIMMPGAVAIPTHQMVLKWLREKCDVYVEIILYSITKPVLYRWCASKNGRVVSDDEKPDTNVVKCFIHGDDTNFTVHYCTYEDAVEAAIKYCLTNLI